MEWLLDNDLIIIPNITKTIKDLISYFWQPSMNSVEYNYRMRNQGNDYKEPDREIDKRKQLSLDNLMVLHIGSDGEYMVSMLGLRKYNCDERILLRNGIKETTLIDECLRTNTELERKHIVNYMSSDCIDLYNEALLEGRYDRCLTMLQGIEAHMK